MFGAESVMAIPNAANASSTANARQNRAGIFGSPTGGSLLYTFLALVVLYIAWAVAAQHERIKKTIEPSNIALNLHNLLTLALSCIVIFGLLKLALIKLVSAKVPGAQTLAAVVGFSLGG